MQTSDSESRDQVTRDKDAPEEGPEEPPRRLVLVVEDNLINQRVLQQQLIKQGFDAIVANDGKEAYDIVMKSKLAEGAPEGALNLAAVLMDMEMPIMDGITATKLIRKMESEGKTVGHVPILGISANARREQRRTPIVPITYILLLIQHNSCFHGRGRHGWDNC